MNIEQKECLFHVINIGADKAFESIKSELKDETQQVILTTYNADYHVEVIEMMIRFIKEKFRVIHLAMLYKTISK